MDDFSAEGPQPSQRETTAIGILTPDYLGFRPRDNEPWTDWQIREQQMREHLARINRIAEDASQRLKMVGGMRQLERQLREGTEWQHLPEVEQQAAAEVLDLTANILGNFDRPEVVKLTLARAKKDTMQEAIVSVRNQVEALLPEDQREVASSVMELAEGLYAQGHNGRRYQTTTARDALEEAKARAAKVRVS